jgi:hypothetical protein
MPSISCYQYRELILNRVIIKEPVKHGHGRPPKVSYYWTLKYADMSTYIIKKAKLIPSGQGDHEKTI